MSLLEQALAGEKYPGAGKVSYEELELLVAWLKGEVSTHAVSRVLKKSSGNVSSWAITRLRAAIDSKQILVDISDLRGKGDAG